MESGAADAPAAGFVLRVEAVRWCIEQLQERKIHPFFPAYLHIRQQAITSGSTTVSPHWPDLGVYLELPGGPTNKPYFRPFWNQSRGAGQEWLNQNLAGSYAGSSLRAQPLKVLTYQDGMFGFPDRHWESAREHLLYSERVPVVPVAGFLYRDFAFQTEGDAPSPSDLVAIFRDDFRYNAPEDDPDTEFEYVFDDAEPSYGGEWFEPLT